MKRYTHAILKYKDLVMDKKYHSITNVDKSIIQIRGTRIYPIQY